MYRALTIAGSDSGGGAGIQADLKTFAALGVYGTSAITALTAQNTRGVYGIHQVPAGFITCQLETVLADIPVQAVKTGMLGDSGTILAVVSVLQKHRLMNLVVDPVMVSQSGARLLEEEAVAVLRDRLLPLALITTPNLPEASFLLGREIDSVTRMEQAARDIHRFGPNYVLLKGGHLPGEEMVDILYDGKQIYYFTARRINTVHTHGTGCTYAAAVTAYLARGQKPTEAVRLAKEFITTAISHSICVGEGCGPTNPMGGLLLELSQARVANSLYGAYVLLQKSPNIPPLLSPGSSNIFYCTEQAESPGDVASFSAPFFLCSERVWTAGEVLFSLPYPESAVLLAAHRQDRRLRSLLTLRYTTEIKAAAEALGWSPALYNGDMPPQPPPMLYNPGGKYQESFCALLAATPADVVAMAAELGRCFRGC